MPNSQIDVVTNMTKEYSRFVFDIGVAYREDVDEVIEDIKGVDKDLRKDPEYKDDILEPIEVLGLDQFANSEVIIKARTTTKPIKQWRVGREFNRRLKKPLTNGISKFLFPTSRCIWGRIKREDLPLCRYLCKTGKRLLLPNNWGVSAGTP